MNRNTLELIVKAGEAVSKDETRLYLNGVHVFKRDNETLSIEATNGHILVRHPAPDEDAETFSPEGIIINRESLKGLADFLRRNKLQDHFLIELTDGLLTLKKGPDACVLTLHNREFPKTQKLIDCLAKDTFEISLNPELLMKLYKAIKPLAAKGKKDAPFENITLQVAKGKNGRIKPIRVIHHGMEESIALIMPTKPGKKEGASNHEKSI